MQEPLKDLIPRVVDDNTELVFFKRQTPCHFTGALVVNQDLLLAATPTQNKGSALNVQILFAFDSKNTHSKVPKMLPLKTTCS